MMILYIGIGWCLLSVVVGLIVGKSIHVMGKDKTKQIKRNYHHQQKY